MEDFAIHVPSFSDPEKKYVVTYGYFHKFPHSGKDWRCTCPAYTFQAGYCKHIDHLQTHLDDHER